VWLEQREALFRWANASPRGPFTSDEVEDWWFAVAPSSKVDVYEAERLDDFFALVHFDHGDPLVQEELGDGERDRYFFFNRLRRNLAWLRELSMVRELARKTWPADSDERELWTEDELQFIADYYGEQQPILETDNDPGEGIDPFTLYPVSYEQSLGFGLDGLAYCMTVLLRSTVIDFVDEILAYSRFPNVRGSLQCVECGTFVGRRALGYGQLYCTERCKKRAAKRRYRAR